MIGIVFAVRARHHLEQIELHYRAIDPDLAIRIVGAILTSTRLLQNLPRAGPVAPRGQYRKWKVTGAPYIIHYRVASDHIRILQVLHSARRTAGS